MAKNRVYLALGTNLGDREENLKQALRTLPPQVEIITVSRLYETDPAYVTDQPAFLNIVAEGCTGLDALELLDYLKQLEDEIGREKTIRYGPRQIDLDIIFYEDLVLNAPHLHIPHPRMNERGFVLHPLADVAPDFVHPVLQQTVQELLTDLPPENGVLNVLDWQPLG